MKSKPTPPKKTSSKPAKASAKQKAVSVEATTGATARKPAKPKALKPPVKTKPAASKKTVKTRKPVPKKLVIPSILLEGDRSPQAPSLPSGPGKPFELAPPLAVPQLEAQTASELPEAYGTGHVSLSARDPHWVYAAWDLTLAQLRAHNRHSASGSLTLRAYAGQVGEKPATEVALHPESQSWFLYVEKPDTKYVAELGYYDSEKNWHSIGVSKPTLTPPDTISSDTTAHFVSPEPLFSTIPESVTIPQVIESVKELVLHNPIVAEAVREIKALASQLISEGPAASAQTEEPVEIPTPAPTPKRQPEHAPTPVGKTSVRDFTRPRIPAAARKAFAWTEEKAQALAEAISMDKVRRVWVGSLEITELLRRELARPVSSQEAAPGAQSAQGAGLPEESISSLGAIPKADRKRGFWFNINAELVLYGATEPNAEVKADGRKIKLRPDGTFSFRFALPDGDYELQMTAASADGDDSRTARLEFRRRTTRAGRVDVHPQDARLKTPRAEHIA